MARYQKLLVSTAFSSSNNYRTLRRGAADYISLFALMLIPAAAVLLDRTAYNSFETLLLAPLVWLYGSFFGGNSFFDYLPVKRPFRVAAVYTFVLLYTLASLLGWGLLILFFQVLDIFRGRPEWELFTLEIGTLIFRYAASVVTLGFVLFTCHLEAIVLRIGLRLLWIGVPFAAGFLRPGILPRDEWGDIQAGPRLALCAMGIALLLYAASVGASILVYGRRRRRPPVMSSSS